MVVTGKGEKSKSKRFGSSYSDKIFDIINICTMILLLAIFMYPLYFVLIASFSEPSEVNAGNVILWIKGFSLDSYKAMLKHTKLWTGYRNSVFYTVLGTVINVVITIFCAYPLSRKDWLPRDFFMKMCLVSMYFGGGLIPTYLVVKNLGMVDTVWAMMIPGALSFYNALIVRNYLMNSIPVSLQEAAELDGANHLQYLVKVVLPLSKPVLAVIALYYAVGHWNDYYTALIYIYDSTLKPLQTVLREILLTTQTLKEFSMNTSGMADLNLQKQLMEAAQSMKYSTIIVAVVPMLIVYPFVQKYFVKGVMIGAIKG